MTGWAILFLLGAATLLALILVIRPGRGPIMLVASALLLGFAGYAWQGSPGLAGRPTPPRAGHRADDSLFASERKIWLEQVGPDALQLDAADNFIRNGDPDYAVGILHAALMSSPQDSVLWIGFGNALVTYADGMVTPPARYAFDQAARYAPDNPQPHYFLGLAYAASGDIDSAEQVWRTLVAQAPAAAPWRARVVEKLAAIARIRAMANAGS